MDGVARGPCAVGDGLLHVAHGERVGEEESVQLAHREPGPDATIRHCPKCNFRMFPVGEVRNIRFHHLRHTTASLPLMNGAELTAVQRIMRHQDPRITTEFYGHLANDHLKRAVERLAFGPPGGKAPSAPPDQEPTSPPQAAQEP
jgi:hypothetical protein